MKLVDLNFPTKNLCQGQIIPYTFYFFFYYSFVLEIRGNLFQGHYIKLESVRGSQTTVVVQSPGQGVKFEDLLFLKIYTAYTCRLRQLLLY